MAEPEWDPTFDWVEDEPEARRDPNELVHLDIEQLNDALLESGEISAESASWMMDNTTFQLTHNLALERFSEAVANPTKENIEKAEEAISLLKKNGDMLYAKDYHWNIGTEDPEQDTHPLKATLAIIARSIEEMDAKIKEFIPHKISHDPYSDEELGGLVDEVRLSSTEPQVAYVLARTARRHAFVCDELTANLKSPALTKKTGVVKHVFGGQSSSDWKSELQKHSGVLTAAFLGGLAANILWRRRD